MKKETALEVYERLQDENLRGWEVQYPEYIQERRQIRYRVRLTHDASTRDGYIPTPPIYLMDTLNEFDLGRVSTSLYHVTDDEVDEEYEADRIVNDEIPRYDYVIDNHGYDEIPRTAEEERAIQLGSKISQALDLPNNVNTRELAGHFETVGELLAASDDELSEIEGVGPKTIEMIRQKRSEELTRRLKKLGKEDRTVLIVEKNEHGTFEPAYDYKTVERINKEFRDSL